MLLLNGLKRSIDVSVFPVFKGIGVYPVVINGQKNIKTKFEKLSVISEEDIIKEDFTTVKEIFTLKTIKDFGVKVMSGTTGFEAQKIKQYVTESKKGIKFTVSGNIDRYEYNNIMVRYMNTKYSQAFITNNENIAKTKWAFWSNPKIIVAGMTKKIEAVYVEEPLAIGVGCYGIYEYGGLDPKALVGLLNSKYLSYYLNIKFKDKHLAGGYLAINKSTIEALPLVAVDKKTQNQIIVLVNKITTQKQQGKDSSKYENEIDELVYKLYNITKEEQKLIERQ
jgi:adenine-specific DNA-methyltransferase